MISVRDLLVRPNAIGISTKKRPSNEPDAFKSDEELADNKKIITADIEKVLEAWRTGEYMNVVIPPIGAGLAKLEEKAPQTWAYLQSELKRLEQEIYATEQLTGVGTFIRDIGDTIATSNRAVYERFEPLGSKGQWKAGGVTGELPTETVLRKRLATNNDAYGLDDSQLNELDVLDQLDSFFNNVNPVLLSPAAQDLSQDWGITMEFVGNKLTYYHNVKGKKQVYKTEATSPEQLLEILKSNRKPDAPESVAGDVMENVDKAIKPEKSSTETPNFGGLGGIQFDPEEAKKNLQKLLAAKRLNEEIQERKKEDDAGCDAPL